MFENKVFRAPAHGFPTTEELRWFRQIEFFKGLQAIIFLKMKLKSGSATEVIIMSHEINNK